MRLIEVTCALFVLAFFAGISLSAVKPAGRLLRESQYLSQNLSRDRFIVESFRRLCAAPVSRSQFDDWCRLCNGLYPRASVSVSQAGFTADSRQVFSCQWMSGKERRQVLALHAATAL